MGCDLHIERIKKSDLNRVKQNFQELLNETISLKELYENGYMCYEDDFDNILENDRKFLIPLSNDGIYLNENIFKDFLKNHNIVYQLDDDTFEINHQLFDKMTLFVKDELTNMIENLVGDGYLIGKYYDLYKNMKKINENLKQDDIIIFNISY